VCVRFSDEISANTFIMSCVMLYIMMECVVFQSHFYAQFYRIETKLEFQFKISILYDSRFVCYFNHGTIAQTLQMSPLGFGFGSSVPRN